MIIRATSRGRTYEYVHLCESIWKNGRSLRRTVVSLGRKDILDAHLDRIYEICRGHKPASPDDPVPLSSFNGIYFRNRGRVITGWLSVSH